MKLSAREIAAFQQTVWGYYRKHRRELPWRARLFGGQAPSAWKILVSEVMLQQTQVERAAPFYKKFVRKFSTPAALARAGLADVLREWSGLGYNRRALHLKRAAEEIMHTHGGRVSRDIEKLDTLPGIGRATAAAILAYAWNEPVVFVETNIRTVFLHHFFPRRKKVNDREIAEVVRQTLPNTKSSLLTPPSFIKEGGRGVDLIQHWYSALMDYGAHMKQTRGNPHARSAHYAKQAAFKGSRRELRGAILRRAAKGGVRARDFADYARRGLPVDAVFHALVSEGFLRMRGGYFFIRS